MGCGIDTVLLMNRRQIFRACGHALRPVERLIVVGRPLILVARLQLDALSLDPVSTNVSKYQSVEFNPRCFRRPKSGELDDAETTNGDSPGCTSSNPSPEESMKRFVENHRLKRAYRIVRNKLRLLSNR
jgi:hypothetical protein